MTKASASRRTPIRQQPGYGLGFVSESGAYFNNSQYGYVFQTSDRLRFRVRMLYDAWFLYLL